TSRNPIACPAGPRLAPLGGGLRCLRSRSPSPSDSTRYRPPELWWTPAYGAHHHFQQCRDRGAGPRPKRLVADLGHAAGLWAELVTRNEIVLSCWSMPYNFDAPELPSHLQLACSCYPVSV